MIMDQAERLRRWVKRRELGVDLGLAAFMEDKLSSKKKIIVFLGSAEEALLNSSFLANLAVAMVKKRKRTIILDACKGKIDPSIFLGIRPRFGLEDILEEHGSKKQAIYTGAGNVKFIKIGDALSALDKLDFKAKNNFFNQWVSLEEEADVILINEDSPGLSTVINDVVLFTSASAKAITCSYENIKQLSQSTPKKLCAGLIINACLSEKEAKSSAKRLILTVKKFLDINIEDLGFLLLEPEVTRALKAKAPFVLKYPYSTATHNLNSIAQMILDKESSINTGLKAVLR